MSYMYKEFTIQHKIISYTNLFLYLSVLKKKLTFLDTKDTKFFKIKDLQVKNTYFMSSNSPSGGMKLMLCSVSNLLSLTHWWNWQSSIAMELFPLVALQDKK